MLSSCNININAHVIARNPSDEVVTSIQDGDYAELSCDDGYTGRGTAHVTCSDGTLDTTEPFVCFESCYLPDNYEFKDESLTEPVEDGLHVDIRCADNFPQTFTIKRSCNNGSFGTLPPCSKPCSLPSLDGTNLMSDATGDVVENGTVVTYSCHDDYNLNGTDDVLCLYGDLIPPDLPQCIAKPCSLPSLDGTNLMSDATGDVVENGTVVTYSCHDDYNLNGTDDVLCLYGDLIPPDLPQCIAKPCSLPSLDGTNLMSDATGDVVENGTVVTYSCHDDYNLNGTDDVLCLYGDLIPPDLPQCIGKLHIGQFMPDILIIEFYSGYI
ncbi:Complement factor H [Holothuria leucospilota]|uniref:Complement factor H n=1 Tax=Holothuria leucospilota TaxID=206669 RepID=A0A9Q1BI83_HOLLE|nr:Complement factor H [Holothuria leucospilota]